jgi:glutamate racemase
MKHLKLYEEFSRYSPIGVLDSGYGGAAILSALSSKFPEYDYVFLGTSPNKPLSDMDDPKSIVEKGMTILKYIGCRTRLVACNTACSLIDISEGDINLIEETIKHMSSGDYGRIGVLATPITIDSGIYQRSLPESIALGCDGWARLVEEIGFMTPEGEAEIKSGLDKLFSLGDVDTILLACTHYILLRPIIESLCPGIRIVSQDDIMVEFFSSNEILASKGGSCKWLTAGDPEEFDREAKYLFGISIGSERTII